MIFIFHTRINSHKLVKNIFKGYLMRNYDLNTLIYKNIELNIILSLKFYSYFFI